MRNRKLQKNSKKIKQIPLWLQFKPKYDGKRQKKRENKNYRSVPFLPDRLEKITKK